MYKYLIMRIMLLAFYLMMSIASFGQGTTSGSITGKITDNNGTTLPGVTVIATHTPSGTIMGTVTNEDGFFRLENLRVGGPYTVRASYTGFGEVALEGIEIRIGESQKYDFEMSEAITELTTVEVVASAGNTGENAGASTHISTEAIERLPTLNRDIDDFLRLTPQASAYSDGTSFAGMNNRYNAIYIDGAVNNDVFGISSSGTNGGQTGISPFSIDIIDQFQVALSPYDVALGGFAGAAVNAVTKSGTNKFAGTAYYFMQNEGLVGKTNQQVLDRTTADDQPTKVAEFNKSTYGASFGGPIIKDKLFFFTNVEIQQDEVPLTYNYGTYTGNDTQDSLNILSDFLKETYNYDPGSIELADKLDGLKFFGKIDWNLSDRHRLTVRHNYTKAEQYDLTANSTNRINFSNTGIYFPSITNSSALELNSQVGENMTNNLIIGFTSVRDDRDPSGADFPYLIIEDGGSNTIRLGSEEFSTGNKLDSDVFTFTDNFKIYKGAHTFTIGTHNEFYSIYNLFLGQNYGTYRYASIGAFMNPLQTAKEYDRAYSLVDDITGDGSAAAADFNAMQLGLYVQDEWNVNEKLSLMGGVRLDMPVINDDPAIDEDFNTVSLPKMQAQYDIANDVEGGKAPDGQLMISPRLGFTYALDSEKKYKLRGGAGVFTSRIPFVWPGAMFNTNGLVQGRVDETTAGEPILFRPDVNDQYTNANFVVPSGDINLFTKDFKYPQVFRGNLGVDLKLFAGLQATVEGIYTKTMNNVVYTNINNDQSTSKTWTGVPDTRVVYSRKAIDATYGAVYVGSNTNEGNSYSVTLSLAKQFDFGMYTSLAFTSGDANALNEGTSSQNSSQWRGQMQQTLGRNNPVYGRSDFALGTRLMGIVSQAINWGGNKNLATTISLFYDGMAGSPYSYVIGGNSGRNINNDQGSTSSNRALVWVPADASEIRLVDYTNSAGNVVTAATQWEQLNAFIEEDPYLSKNRGQYAEKNSNFMPYTSFLDLSIRQDLGMLLGQNDHKLQLSLDIFNVLNLISSDWGVRYSVPGDFNNFYLYDFTGYESDGTTPKFNYTYGDRKGNDALNISDYSSRWQMRLGVRYIFN